MFFCPYFRTFKGVRGVCSSEKKDADNKTCHAALLFIPKADKIPIAEIGKKKNGKAKFGISAGLPAEVLFNVENWECAKHDHRGRLVMTIKFNSFKLISSDLCRDS